MSTPPQKTGPAGDRPAVRDVTFACLRSVKGLVARTAADEEEAPRVLYRGKPLGQGDLINAAILYLLRRPEPDLAAALAEGARLLEAEMAALDAAPAVRPTVVAHPPRSDARRKQAN